MSTDEPDTRRREALGLEPGLVRIVAYDERWPALFVDEAAAIRAAIAAAELPPLALEHIGSTAVPGQASKPVLDIAAGYESGTFASVYIGVFESLAYHYRGETGLPGREYFRRGEPRTHHVHLVERFGPHWVRFLRFRDALRDRAAVRDAYAALKCELAVRYPRNREAYLHGKAEFIDKVIQQSA